MEHERIDAGMVHAARTWMEAAFRRDMDACAQALADEFSMVTDRGSQIDKVQWLHNKEHRVGGGTPPEFLAVRVQRFGDAAVMTSRNILQAAFDGADWSNELYLTDVWVHRNGRWQLVRRHASRVHSAAD